MTDLSERPGKVKSFLRLVAIEHSVFALPFAYLSALTVMNRDLISVLDLVYESLVELNDDQEPVPSLAESWEVQGGGKTWIFHIRDGVYFHDGRKLTADDKFTFELLKVKADEAS